MSNDAIAVIEAARVKHEVVNFDKYGSDAFYQNAMIFAVVGKEEPYIGQCFEMSPIFWPAQTEAYLKICNTYPNWVNSGPPATAWRDKQIMENWRG